MERRMNAEQMALDAELNRMTQRRREMAKDANVPTGSQPGSDADIKRDEGGKFTSAGSASEHSAAAEHRGKMHEHHSAQQSPAHKSAAERHAIAKKFHEQAATSYANFQKNRHMLSSIANESGKEAARHTANAEAK